MSKKRGARLDPRILALLQCCGKTHTLDRSARHYQLRVEGKLVTVLPSDYRAGEGSQANNALAAVRRYLRGLT